MTRFRATSEGNIPFTAEEEAEWDAMVAAYVHPTETPEPTKEQLMAELSALTAKIQALG